MMTMSEVIPAQAVEAAAKVLLQDSMSDGAGSNVPEITAACEAVMIKALEAAAPYMFAEAKSKSLEEVADKVMGPSDVLLDAATCRWIAMELRERAASIKPTTKSGEK